MSGFRITKAAERDLVEIAACTLETWGEEQCIRYIEALDGAFHRLAQDPTRAHSCEHIRQGYFRYRQGKHVIFFRKGSAKARYRILVVRVLHERMLNSEIFGRIGCHGRTWSGYDPRSLGTRLVACTRRSGWEWLGRSRSSEILYISSCPGVSSSGYRQGSECRGGALRASHLASARAQPGYDNRRDERAPRGNVVSEAHERLVGV